MMMDWTSTDLDARAQKLAANLDGAPVTWRQMIDGWLAGDGHRFGTVLADQDLEACFWECPPLTRAALSTPFECVLVAAPALSRIEPDPRPFEDRFREPGTVAVFPNLGGDAELIAPLPTANADCSHLLAFCRSAGPRVQCALWRAVAEVADRNLDDRPRWLSTSGLGVAWLHVRWDRTPKYYQHDPYRA